MKTFNPLLDDSMFMRLLRLHMAFLIVMLGLKHNLKAQATQLENQYGDTIIAVSAPLCDDMKLHHVLQSNLPVGCERLRLVKFTYLGFDGLSHDDGEIIVMDAVATHVANIFKALLSSRFPIAKAKLMNEYEGNDEASMADNNTSAFNQRLVTNSDVISLHAYGLAIDVNPVQNPYMKGSNDSFKVKPPAGANYVNRLTNRPWKKVRSGMAETIIDVFADNGFLIWGGYWDNPIDYQHFQVGRSLAERLARAAPKEAEVIFSQIVERYRTCRRMSHEIPALARIQCIMVADPTADQSIH